MVKLAALVTALAFTAASGTRPPEPVSAPAAAYILGTALPADQVRQLVLQAVAFSRYPMPKKIPIVDLIPSKDFAAKVCKTDPDCVEVMLGYYIVTQGDIVHVRVGTDRPVDGIAVHEIVHWLQALNGWGFASDCQDMAAHEIEAYSVEYVRDTWAHIERPLDIPNVYEECVANQKVK
jgi:hypothetical protein